jgi:hypothetical protein
MPTMTWVEEMFLQPGSRGLPAEGIGIPQMSSPRLQLTSPTGDTTHLYAALICYCKHTYTNA